MAQEDDNAMSSLVMYSVETELRVDNSSSCQLCCEQDVDIFFSVIPKDSLKWLSQFFIAGAIDPLRTSLLCSSSETSSLLSGFIRELRNRLEPDWQNSKAGQIDCFFNQ